jgi:hypothetical protein
MRLQRVFLLVSLSESTQQCASVWAQSLVCFLVGDTIRSLSPMSSIKAVRVLACTQSREDATLEAECVRGCVPYVG